MNFDNQADDIIFYVNKEKMFLIISFIIKDIIKFKL